MWALAKFGEIVFKDDVFFMILVFLKCTFLSVAFPSRCSRPEELLLTFGQRVPAGPVGDSLIKEVPAVPSVVHPTVSVRVGPRQLSSHTNPHVPNNSHFHTQQRSDVCNIWKELGFFGVVFFKSVHLSEDFVIRSGCVCGPPSNARVSRLVEGIIGYHSSSMEVGRQDKIVVLHPFYDCQSLWFNLWRIFNKIVIKKVAYRASYMT